MTDPDLVAARALCETPIDAPWTVKHSVHGSYVLDANGHWVADCGSDKASADFIAAARTGWPAALDEIERLTRELIQANDTRGRIIDRQQPLLDLAHAACELVDYGRQERHPGHAGGCGDIDVSTFDLEALGPAVDAFRKATP